MKIGSCEIGARGPRLQVGGIYPKTGGGARVPSCTKF